MRRLALPLGLVVTASAIWVGCSGGGGGGGGGGGVPSTGDTIGRAGGTITTSEGVTLEIPPDALGADTLITVARATDIDTKNLPAGVPADTVGPAFRFEPSGLRFAKPATLKVPVSASSPRVVIALRDDLNGTVEFLRTQTSGSTATASLLHFSTSQPVQSKAPPPTITSISPNVGLTRGGDRISIVGNDFRAQSSAIEVRFGGVLVQEALIVTSSLAAVGSNGLPNRSTEITVLTPPNPVGIVDVTVKNVDGPETTVPGAFKYVLPPPTLTRMLPNGGPIAGGTTITIKGTSFDSSTTFKLGNSVLTGTVQDSQTFVGTAPPSAVGLVALTATNPQGQAVLSNAYFYGPPTFTAVSPVQVSPSGGTRVTIDGTGFYEGMTVSVVSSAGSGQASVEQSSLTPTRIVAVAPNMDLGPASLVIANNGGSVMVPNVLDYSKPWTPANAGLRGGWVTWVTFDPKNPMNALAVVDKGGFYRSTDGGATWSESNAAANPTAGFPYRSWGSAVIDSRSSTVLAPRAKSSDGGVTWSVFGNGPGSGSAGIVTTAPLVGNPNDSSIFVCGDSNAVRRSTDGGFSYSGTGTGTGGVALALAYDPVNPQNVYVGTTSGVGKSTNGAASFSAVGTGLPAGAIRAIVVDPSAPLAVYAGTDGSGVYKSVDGGSTWAASNTGMGATVVTSIAIDPLAAPVVYAGTKSGQLWKSLDAGATWSALPISTLGRPVSSIAIDLSTSTKLLVGTLGGHGVLRSTDGGATWTVSNVGLELQPIADLAVDSTTPATLYAGARYGGVFKTTNAGATWSFVGTGLTDAEVLAIAVDPAAPSTVYVGTKSSGVFKTTDGGTSWTQANAGLGNVEVGALVIDPLTTPATVYAGTLDGVWKTTDGGASWSRTHVSLSGEVAALTRAPSSGKIYAGVSGDCAVYSTTNGGTTWTAESPVIFTANFGCRIAAVAVDEQTPRLYAAIPARGVWSGGGSLVISSNPLTIEVVPNQPSRSYCCDNATILATEDRFVNKVGYSIGSGAVSYGVNAFAFDPNVPTTAYAGTDAGVYKTLRGGQ